MSLQPGTYNIINAKSGTALDLNDSEIDPIAGHPSHGGESQKWCLEQIFASQWTIRNVQSGGYLRVEGNEDGTSVTLSDVPFGWDIKPEQADPNEVRIYIPDTSTPINVDLADFGSTTSGTPVVIFKKWDGKNQIWRLQQVEI
ncbi:carbohydrate-binding module family 13 protein [Sphaerobolus stellatus SS14]|uniref:Carbohydrate-binding module family 13 protein n=1 Tax=Sphaerobolus stellatus (strain SS14) TaxID=990650 RepID=A0A0C9VDC1_SPHS4|nr:carbohydrate-binding module family 13 protein [Sphaerobolus stellatus SS14]